LISIEKHANPFGSIGESTPKMIPHPKAYRRDRSREQTISGTRALKMQNTDSINQMVTHEIVPLSNKDLLTP